MKTIYRFSLIVIIVCCTITAHSQVAINTVGTQPHNSAMLDISSNEAGLLIPKLNETQRDNLPSPATGLIIFNTSSERFNYYTGNAWRDIAAVFETTVTGSIAFDKGVAINLTGNPAAQSAMLDVQSSDKGLLIPRTTSASVSEPAAGLLIYNSTANALDYYDGVSWQTPCQEQVSVVAASGSSSGKGVAINPTETDAHNSAMLDVSSETKGVLIPRLTDAERNAILPAIGLLIYNTTSKSLQFYTSGGWFRIIIVPSPPMPGSSSAIGKQITWNWQAVPAALGYKYNTVNDYNTATDNGTSTTYTEDGLNCLETHYLYVWAYNACGHSYVTELSHQLFCCPLSPTVTDIDENIYNTTQIAEQCWMAENLKVTKNPAGNNITRLCYGDVGTNCNIYGGLYNWSTMMNGSGQSSTNPSGVQGICPDGWHIPSHSEWSQLANNITGGNTTGGNRLKSCRQAGSPLGGDCSTTSHPRWNFHSTHYGTNDYGFSALPSGYRATSAFYGLGEFTYFPTTTELDGSTTHAIYRQLRYNYANVDGGINSGMAKTTYHPIRCIRTCTEPPSQPSSIIGPVNPATNSTGVVYSVVNEPDFAYTWTLPSGWIITDGQGTNQITVEVGTVSGVVSVVQGNACGNGQASTLNVHPWVECGDNLSFTYRNQWVNYGTVTGQNGTCWLDRNLGASRVAVAYNDMDAYGDLFQWGRLDDGHQLRTSESTQTLSNSDNPGHGLFIRADSDWRSPKNDNLWQGVSGINNPCPEGWRIPVETEWNNEKSVFSPNNLTGAFNSSLILPAAGYRHHGAGSVSSSGTQAEYWSSGVSGIYARLLVITNSLGAYIADYQRAEGSSVRCIKDCTAPPAQPALINGPVAPCQGSLGNIYNVLEVMITNYIWEVPEGWVITSGQNTNQITVTAGTVSGTISVIPYNSCGQGEARTLAVTVTPGVPAQPTEIQGNDMPCPQTFENYSVENIPGLTYTWFLNSYSSLWVIDSGQGTNSITVYTSNGSADLSVTASNVCGESEPQEKSMIARLHPAISSHPGNQTVCIEGNTYFQISGGADGEVFQWQVNTGSGWADITSAGGNPVYSGWATKTLNLTWVVSANDGYQYRCRLSGTCAPTLTSDAATLYVVPHVVEHPLNSIVCEGGGTSYHVVANGKSLSYKWQVNTGSGWSSIVSSGSNPTYANWSTTTLTVNNVVAGNNGYQYCCQVITDDCNITGQPEVSNAALLVVLSPPSTPSELEHTTGETTITWRWSAVSGATGYKFNTVNNYNTATDNGTTRFYYQTGLSCCANYTLYVWAYGICGVSEPIVLNSGTFQQVNILVFNVMGGDPCTGGDPRQSLSVSNPESNVTYFWKVNAGSWIAGNGTNGRHFPGDICCGYVNQNVVSVKAIRNGVSSSIIGSYICAGTQ